MKGLCTATLLLLAAALAGCSHRAEPLDLPDPEAVAVLEVTVWKGSFWERHEISNQYYITDRLRIAEIMELLRKNNTEYWRGPDFCNWCTDYTIYVWGKPGKTDFYLNVERKWFGGAERDRWPAANRERRMSASERERLVALIAKGI